MPSNVKLLAGASGGEPTDANFKNVTLLLHGDGSNGAQNNTFIDSSTNNFTITRNGNTTQGSFSPYGSNWSNYFDGSTGFLTLNAQTALSFGTGDFTLEAWVNPSSTNSGFAPVIEARGSGVAQTYAFGLRVSGGVYKAELYTGTQYTGSTTVSLNTWTHIAVTRSSGTLRIFVNGVLDTSWSSMTTSVDANGSTQRIGSLWDGAGFYFPGYISNFRAIKGTAVYTSAFTPSTAPLTAITNTSLLTCAYNRFRDGSTNNFTITTNGDVKVTNFAPFAPSSAYITATNGGSAYFDGSGDYLTTPLSTNLQFGTGDFTVECWTYFTAKPANYPCIWGNYNSYTSGALSLFYGHISGNSSKYQVAVNGASFPVIQSSTSIAYNSWVHLAVVRSNGTITLYVNGVADGTYNASGVTLNGVGPSFCVGTAFDNITNGYINGYVSNLRIVKGTAVYTSNFTPPTSPTTAITNTQLLLNATNAAIFDNSMKNDLETVGNAQISTSVKKFGAGSMAFDGTGDWLIMPATPDNRINGDGNFTIEMWAYFNSVASDQRLIAWDNNSSNYVIAMYTNTSGNLAYYISSTGSSWNIAQAVTMGSISTNTWYHIALVRNGSTFTPYINGVAGTTTTSSATLYSSTLPFVLGAVGNGASNFNGYIDDFRITKGIARYTANFTPPTAPFPNK